MEETQPMKLYLLTLAQWLGLRGSRGQHGHRDEPMTYTGYRRVWGRGRPWKVRQSCLEGRAQVPGHAHILHATVCGYKPVECF